MHCPRSAALFLILSASSRIAAQDSIRTKGDTTHRTVLLGSPEEDRLRIAQLVGGAQLAGSLIRSPSMYRVASPATATTAAGAGWSAIRPVIDATWNSQIPFSVDDGNLWAGRGLSSRAAIGLRANAGPVQFLFMPDIVHVENRNFNLLPSDIPGRSAFASPFHAGALSADVPVRFGSQSFTIVDPGQSAIWYTHDAIDAGVSTENQWWGPAIQNALIMSNNAPGIPEAFVRTNRPLHTAAGDVEAKAIVGSLTESLYFDQDPTNDHRAISGIVATFAPAIEPTFTAGIARVVYSATGGGIGDVAGHSLDALTRWSATRASVDSAGTRGIDQLFSLFGRWVFPASGLELYAEWARMSLPVSVRELLVAPQSTQGYTLGMQVAGNVRPEAKLRFQAEFTDLEQTPSSRAADTLSFYVSRAVPQGYTQRGKVIGAAIGPGASSQLLALDYMPAKWDVGVFAERIRWDDDAYYLQSTGFSFFSHDLTVLAGLRGTVRLMHAEIHAELSTAQRLNFEFQNLRGGFGPQKQNDVHNKTLKLWISP
jgi:Capsule assembly protein Wzi